MQEHAAKPTEFFTLNLIAPGLEGFAPPDPVAPPGETWRHRYGIYTLAGACHRLGTLTLVREPVEADRFRLRVRTDAAQAAGARHVVEGAYVCRADACATPESWTYACESFGRDGEPIADLRVEGAGRLLEGAFEAGAGPTRRRTLTSERVAANWGLFDVVQRLPRGPVPPLTFDLVDHFDQHKPGHTLNYAGAYTVLLGGRRVGRQSGRALERGQVLLTRWEEVGASEARLHRFDQHGHGVVPWVYWTDDGGRLLFVVSGIEAYIWDAAQEGED